MDRKTLLSILLLSFAYSNAQETVTVNTGLGPVEGEVIEAPNGFKINSFKGIPFAKPPVGPLRFEKPEPVEPWTETLKAMEWAPRCIYMKMIQDEQMDKLFNPGPKSEDCLYLNIFAPKEQSPNFPHGYPVMFWVYGGGFVIGGAQEYGIPEGLITKDVIYVSIHYRVSLMGFFALEDGSGNFGLWDQTLALKWVRDHIGAFGGDPSRVTVFGESAGGASASILSLSPHSSGLFQNAIPMSGSATNTWAARSGELKATVYEHSRAIAESLQCTGSSGEILDCLRKFPAETLEEAQSARIDVIFKNGVLGVGPVLDGDFFPKDISTLLKEAPKKPTMAGVMDVEGFLWALPFFPMKMDLTIENFDTFSMADFEEKLKFLVKDFKKFENPDLIKRLVVHEFVDSKGNRTDRNLLVRKWAEIVGDWMVTQEVVKENTQKINLNWPIWFYNFEHFNPAIFPEPFRFDGMAAFHAGELSYVFGRPLFGLPFEQDKNDIKVAEIVTTLWTNFAKHSNPTPEPIAGVTWQPLTKENPTQYLKIKAQPKMKRQYRKEANTFWNRLVPDIENMDFVWKTNEEIKDSGHTEL